MVKALETYLSTLGVGILLKRTGLENPAISPSADAIRSEPASRIPGLRDCVTEELLLRIEAQLPNVAASSLGLRALRDRLTIQISEAQELRSRFPDSFLRDRVSPVLTKPYFPHHEAHPDG